MAEFLILQQQVTFKEAENIFKGFDNSATVGFINNIEENEFVIGLADPLVVDRQQDRFLLMLGYNDPTEEGARVTNKYFSLSEKADLAFFNTEFVFPWFENAPVFEGENGACVYMIFGEFGVAGSEDDNNFIGEWTDQNCDAQTSALLCRRDIITLAPTQSPTNSPSEAPSISPSASPTTSPTSSPVIVAEQDIVDNEAEQNIVLLFLITTVLFGALTLFVGFLAYRNEKRKEKLEIQLATIDESLLVDSSETRPISFAIDYESYES